MPTLSATSRTVKRRFPRIIARTLSTWLSFVDVECHPRLGFSPTDILPPLKGLNHSEQSSRYVRLSNWNVSVKLLPS